MNIVVLAGGLSPERDVSLSSGSRIAGALRERGHAAVLVDLSADLELPEAAQTGLFDHPGQACPVSVPETAPTPEELASLRAGRTGGLFGKGVLSLCQKADVVFLALHGEDGENGKVQACFDLLHIRYTGSGSLPCALAMDKALAKLVMGASGIKTPMGVLLNDKEAGPAGVADRVGFPCVVKPVSGGSSIGVAIVRDLAELEQAVSQAARYDASVLIEEYVSGREISVGILNGEALPPIEIRPREGFYDYRNKYQPGLTEEICPAPLSSGDTRKLQNMAVEAHHALGLGDYSRIDFIRTEAGEFFCLEANSLPGMTPTSLLPQEAGAVGISYPQLCETIARAAQGRTFW